MSSSEETLMSERLKLLKILSKQRKKKSKRKQKDPFFQNRNGENMDTKSTDKQIVQYTFKDNAYLLPVQYDQQITGPMAKTTRRGIYIRIASDISSLKKLLETYNLKSLMQFVKSRFDAELKTSNTYDMAILKLVEGYYAIEGATTETNLIKAKLKTLRDELDTFDMSYPNYVKAMLNYQLFLSYTKIRKYGKAWRYLQTAKDNLRTAAANAWTAQILEGEAELYLTAAYGKTPSQKKLCLNGLQCYKTAFAHCMNHPYKDEGIYFEAAFYLINMVCLTLDMPTPYFVGVYNKTDIVWEHSCQCNITIVDIKDAKNMLIKAYEYLHECTTNYHSDLKYYLSICSMYYALRKAQVHKDRKEYEQALLNITQAVQMYRFWDATYGNDSDAEISVLQKQLQPFLIKLRSEYLQYFEKDGNKRHLVTSDSKLLTTEVTKTGKEILNYSTANNLPTQHTLFELLKQVFTMDTDLEMTNLTTCLENLDSVEGKVSKPQNSSNEITEQNIPAAIPILYNISYDTEEVTSDISFKTIGYNTLLDDSATYLNSEPSPGCAVSHETTLTCSFAGNSDKENSNTAKIISLEDNTEVCSNPNDHRNGQIDNTYSADDEIEESSPGLNETSPNEDSQDSEAMA